ncbi:Hsp70 family protein [Desulfonema magnum]|uniref:Chaperone Hsp70 family protein n=1 Tax=Desulfonema magnum TaxID=45655 RepID=A0A975BYT5_9BACT|nr:Hsp70 family protein [Desulfonema magnum]QTA93697.1 Chaperone Hsp70 family protein [Desulfonema magnum]
MGVDSDTNPVLGFDLGTTFSAVARWTDGRGPRIIQNKTGLDTTQSVVYRNPANDEMIVGRIAYHRGLMSPENMIVGVKRLMDETAHNVHLGGKAFTPVELSAMILKKIYNDAKSQYPKGVFSSRGSVVTVPFYFKAHQIDNTRQAAEMADINCIGIIQEPIAASLLYAFQLCEEHSEQEFSQNILVFDLGGGTFDLTLFHLEHTKTELIFEVLGAGGDDRLGGMDFDKCLGDVILEKGEVSLQGLDPVLFNKAQKNLFEHAVNAKIALGASSEYFVAIPFILPDKHIEISMTRGEFEKSIIHYLHKIEGIIDSLWAKAGVKPSEVDRVIRVGGSSGIPCVKALLDDVVGGEKVWGNINPSTSVAEGASMYAAYLDDKEFFDKEIIIRTRTCHALGLKTAGDYFTEIIPANRKTPCSVKRLFTTNEDNATSLDIEIFQGSGRIVKAETHSHIGTIQITNLPPRPAGELDIEVNFKVNEEQILSVTVTAEGHRKSTTLNYT